MPPKSTTSAASTPAGAAAAPAAGSKENRPAWGPKSKAAASLATRAAGSATPPAAGEAGDGTPTEQSIPGGRSPAQMHLDPEPQATTPGAVGGSTGRGKSGSESRQDRAVPTAHMLVGRIKGTTRDMIRVIEVQGPSGVKDSDEFIGVLEEALRAIKTAKVDAKTSRTLGGAKGGVTSSPSSVPPPKQPYAPTNPAVATAESPTTPTAPAPTEPVPVKSVSPPPPAATAGAAPASPPATKSYASIAKGLKTPTKEKLAVEQERKVLAARGAERQGDAEAKRRQLEHEKKVQGDTTAERVEKAKERREAVVEGQRQSQAVRHEGATKRADEKVDERKKKAETQNSRVDEVVTIQHLQEDMVATEQSNKEEERVQMLEQRTLSQQKLAKERAEAHSAVLEKGKELAEQKAAQLQKQADHRDEAKKKADETKKAEVDARASKTEQRQQKVAENQQKVQEEAEAKLKRAEERSAQSAKLREEQQAAAKQKAANEVNKLQKAKERRGDGTSLQASVLSTLAEEIDGGEAGSPDISKAQQKINRICEQVGREADLYLESYVESASKGHKDLNKTKLRAALQRLHNTTVVETKPSTVRACLHEVLNFCGGQNEGVFSDLDQEFMRYNDQFKTLIEVASQAHKKMPRDLISFRMATDIIRRLLLDPKQGDTNVDFFLQSGGLLPFIQLMADEIKAVRGLRGPANFGIGVSLTFVQASLTRLLDSSCKLVTLREQIMDLLTAAGVWNYSLAVAQATLKPSEMPSLLASLGVLAQGLPIVAKRKAAVEEKAEWLRKIVEALLNLMNSVLCPGGSPMKPQTDLVPAATAVMFLATRILNTVARHDIPFLQSLVSPPSSSTPDGERTTGSSNSSGHGPSLHHEMFHMIAAFVNHLCDHTQSPLEPLPAVNASSVPARALSPALKDGLKFGLTSALPPPPVLAPSDSGPEGTPRQLQTPKRTADRTYLRAAVHEMLLFVGYISVLNEPVQELFSFSSGDRPLLSTLLNAIPIQYFANCRVSLFPALVSLSYNNAKNVEILQREMQLDELKEFLEEEMSMLKKKPHTPATAGGSAEADASAGSKKGAAATTGDKPASKTKLTSSAVKENEKKKTAEKPKAEPVLVTRSWVDMMEDEDDGVTFDDPLAGPDDGFNSLSKIQLPAWARGASGNTQITESVLSDPTSASGDDEGNEALLEEMQREERLRGMIKGSIPAGVPSTHIHFRLSRRFPVDQWALARDFYVVQSGGSVDDEAAQADSVGN